jgi:RNA polymerase primary sigma factor
MADRTWGVPCTATCTSTDQTLTGEPETPQSIDDDDAVVQSLLRPLPDNDDPIPDDVMAQYLREISRVPLLSAEAEQRLARLTLRGRHARRRLETMDDLAAEESERLRRWVQVGERARIKLINSNSRLVISVAKRYAGLGVALPDLIQEGNIGLMRAVEKFDPRRGFKLSTYATWWIRQAITRALSEQGRMIRLPVHTCERLQQVMRVSRALTQELGREPQTSEIAARAGLPEEKVAAVLLHAQQPLSLDMAVGAEHEGQLGDFVEDEATCVPSERLWSSLLQEQVQELLNSLSPREDRILQMRYGLRDGHAYTLDEVGTRFGLTRERIRQIEAQALGKLRQPSRSSKLIDYLA